MMIFFWIIVIIALFYLLGNHKKYDGNDTKKLGIPAEEVLKMRYVNGEIDEKTYTKMKKTIV